jgi:lysine 2,3-aminomutase
LAKSATVVTTTISHEVEEEPPSNRNTKLEAKDEEPPGKRFASQRNGLFTHVSASDWNDWKWHFRNRITTVEELSRLISLTAEELTICR